MIEDPAFLATSSLDEAVTGLALTPRAPVYAAGHDCQGWRLHVRDHRGRSIPAEQRTLESHFGAWVLSQSVHSPAEARRLAIGVSYGSARKSGALSGHPARIYGLGPEVFADDFDGRSPAVVVRHDDGMLYLVASTGLSSGDLVRIADWLHG